MGYAPNILNKFDSYTYNWTLYIQHPSGGSKMMLAKNGVDDRINISNVQQQAVMTFKEENRSAVANRFNVQLIEPGGLTLFNKIVEASSKLGIQNHLEAAYVMEVVFNGWYPDGSPGVVGPYSWTCVAEAMPMQHRDGASFYELSLIETKLDAYRRIYFHTHSEMNITASTYGDFLDKFSKELNEQSMEEVKRHPFQMYPTEYAITSSGAWSGWQFDATANANASSAIQVQGGGGTLTFTLPQGTAITTAMAIALFHTRNFRRIYTQSGFALDFPEKVDADPNKIAAMVNWVTFDTKSEITYYEPILQCYQRKLTYSASEYVAPEASHDPKSYGDLINSSGMQNKRIGTYFGQGLLRKRYDYTYTGLNTEVENLEVVFNNAFYAIQAFNSGFGGSGTSGIGFSNSQEDAVAKLKLNRNSIISKITGLTNSITLLQSQLDALGVQGIQSSNILDQLAQANATLAEQQRALASADTAVDEAYAELLANTPKITAESVKFIDKSGITPEMHFGAEPNTHKHFQVNSLATLGPETPGETGVGAAKLGALEMNLNQMADMLEINLDIRGDPYWFGKNGGAPYEKGGNAFFLNMNFPSYPNENDGLMRKIGDYSLRAVYRVLEVNSTYAEGKFSQTLRSYYDTNTNPSLVKDRLLRGG